MNSVVMSHVFCCPPTRRECPTKHARRPRAQARCRNVIGLARQLFSNEAIDKDSCAVIGY
jgi:hypothetical protein